jgi:hypothetical protein
MATKTATKTSRNAKAAGKATTTKATKKNATVVKPAAKESKPADKKMSQIEAAVAVLAKTKEPMNCKSVNQGSPCISKRSASTSVPPTPPTPPTTSAERMQRA